MITPRDPSAMTDAECQQELAAILARGYLRWRAKQEAEKPANPLAEWPPTERSCANPVSTGEEVA